MKTPLEHVVIVGCGLLGTSLGLAMNRRGLARTITGVGRAGSPSVSVAMERGAIHRATDNAAVAVSGARLAGEDAAIGPAQLVVVCTPVRQIAETLRVIGPAVGPDAVVTDVGSKKLDVMRWAEEILPGHAHFVGSHPMAGSEKSGPEAAREDLYRNAVCLVCRPERTVDSALKIVTGLWEGVGMRVITCTGAEHDGWVAAISHLPHVLVSALVNTVAGDRGAMEVAAGGFIDTTRIASGDVTMWTDILMTNRRAVSEALGRFAGELGAMKHAIDRGDEGEIRAALEAAKETRDAFIARRQKSMGGGPAKEQ